MGRSKRVSSYDGVVREEAVGFCSFSARSIDFLVKRIGSLVRRISSWVKWIGPWDGFCLWYATVSPPSLDCARHQSSFRRMDFWWGCYLSSFLSLLFRRT
ncbi:unnamed protein product [Microthlaspi erraticum]|uniref:Uncharacterized protein n=1 Tax=Microthlaspi erraticum TaxID=1685480 RepID=A0A6D2HQX1_9BRAS|nr:unnamed protein product [Microthlaspi erraticum]